MRNYLLFNLAVFVLTGVLVLCFTRNRRELVRNLRISIIMVCIAVPWDFFAIQNRSWIYPNDPGPTLFTVPLNDLGFIFLATMITCTALTRVCFRIDPGGQDQSESEDGSNETPHNDVS